MLRKRVYYRQLKGKCDNSNLIAVLLNEDVYFRIAILENKYGNRMKNKEVMTLCVRKRGKSSCTIIVCENL